MTPFRCQDVSDWIVASEEPLGSKDKDWLRPTAKSPELWLYKRRREDSGDDWAEKVGEQLANLLRVPHAEVELAQRSGARGVIVRDFRPAEGGDAGRFIPGNELLWNRDASYPKDMPRRVAQYTVDRCLTILVELHAGPPSTGVRWDETLDAPTMFVGYLLLDAWIGNQDRHHENWGVVMSTQGAARSVVSLAPSFDHASSLGQNETDEKREYRLTTNNSKANIETWARKARSPFYPSELAPRPTSIMEAFAAGAMRYPAAGKLWLDRLRVIDSSQIEATLADIPDSLLSPIGRRFTLRLLELNRRELLRRFVT